MDKASNLTEKVRKSLNHIAPGTPAKWQMEGKTHEEQFRRKIMLEHKVFIYRCFADGLTAVSIVKELKEHYGIDIHIQSIHSLKRSRRTAAEIEKLKQNYLKKVEDVGIASKRVRLCTLERIRVKLEAVLSRLDLEKKSGRAEAAGLIRRLIETVCAARAEMEGKPVLVQQFSVTELNHLTDEEIERRRRVLLGRTAEEAQNSFDASGEAGAAGAGVREEVSNPAESAEVSVAASEELQRC